MCVIATCSNFSLNKVMPNLNFQQVLALIFVILIPILSFNQGHKTTSTYLSPLMNLTEDFELKYLNFGGAVIDTSYKYLNLISLQKKNEQLRMQMAQLYIKNKNSEAITQENKELREVLNISKRLPKQLIASEVLAYSPVPDLKTILISKGRDFGLYKELGVLNEKGEIIGTLIEVRERSSIVLLATDPLSVLPGVGEVSGKKALIKGGGPGKLSAIYPYDDNVPINEKFVVSSFDPNFPSGFYIGSSVAVDRKNSEASQKVHIRSADSHNLKYVLIYIPGVSKEVHDELTK